MATLTGHRNTGGSHLKLVHSRDDGHAMTMAPTGVLRDLDDPDPGPRDASMLVSRFARILPGDTDLEGVFSLGES